MRAIARVGMALSVAFAATGGAQRAVAQQENNPQPQTPVEALPGEPPPPPEAESAPPSPDAEPAPDPAPRPLPSRRPSRSDEPWDQPVRFGKAGQLVLDAGFSFSYRNTALSYMGREGPSSSQLQISPTFSYFLADNFFVSAVLYLQRTWGDQADVDRSAFGAGPALGVHLAATARLSVLPSMALVYNRYAFEAEGSNISGYEVIYRMSVPLLIHLHEHVFFGVGPYLAMAMTSKQEGMDAWRARTFGVNGVIGVWW